MKCSKCGDKLTPEEIKEIIEDSGWANYPAEPICDQCFWERENNFIEPDNFSDADPGL